MIRYINLLLPLIFLAAAIGIVGQQQAKGWDGPWASYNGPYQEGCGAYCAGQTDAVYDHESNIGYQPYGSCLPCHCEEYWINFRQGYDQQWNTYQGQSTDQGSSGNNNYVNMNQYSNQLQNPLQQLERTVCGFINCNQPPQPQQTSWGP